MPGTYTIAVYAAYTEAGAAAAEDDPSSDTVQFIQANVCGRAVHRLTSV